MSDERMTNSVETLSAHVSTSFSTVLKTIEKQQGIIDLLYDELVKTQRKVEVYGYMFAVYGFLVGCLFVLVAVT